MAIYPPSVFEDLARTLEGHHRVFVVVGSNAVHDLPVTAWLVDEGWRLEEQMLADRFTPGVMLFSH